MSGAAISARTARCRAIGVRMQRSSNGDALLRGSPLGAIAQRWDGENRHFPDGWGGSPFLAFHSPRGSGLASIFWPPRSAPASEALRRGAPRPPSPAADDRRACRRAHLDPATAEAGVLSGQHRTTTGGCNPAIRYETRATAGRSPRDRRDRLRQPLDVRPQRAVLEQRRHDPAHALVHGARVGRPPCPCRRRPGCWRWSAPSRGWRGARGRRCPRPSSWRSTGGP